MEKSKAGVGWCVIVFRETKEKILFYASREEATWSQLKRELKLSDKVLASHLRDLREKDIIRKKGRKYVLTDTGIKLLERHFAQKQPLEEGKAERELEPLILRIRELPVEDQRFSEDVKRFFFEKFIHIGLAADLTRKFVTAKTTLLTFGLLPIFTPSKSFTVGERGRVYLRFLSEVYVEAVDFEVLRKAKEEGRDVTDVVEFVWRMCKPTCWKEADRVLGYAFDFPTAYEKVRSLKEMREANIETILKECGMNHPRRAFARLKVISHPILERGKVIKAIWSEEFT